jgi:hypothetical protein
MRTADMIYPLEYKIVLVGDQTFDFGKGAVDVTMCCG